MQTTVYLVNAFSSDPNGGNPAGVVLNADSITTEQRQKIAAKVGFSETAFVSGSPSHDYRIDFYTPLKKIPNCGHATVGTFSFMKARGLILKDKINVQNDLGTTEVSFSGSFVRMGISRSTYQDFDEKNELLLRMNSSIDACIHGLRPVIASSGNPFILFPLASEKALKELVLDKDYVNALSDKLGVVGIYAFYLTADDRVVARARMFAPIHGIDEESATGMAAAPLASYLIDQNLLDKTEFIIEQGRYMNPPSLSYLHAKISDSLVEIAGEASLRDEKIISV
ncbi:MAG: PhzF family phenazine biosynthesis protein [Bacteriovoracia bacterium]